MFRDSRRMLAGLAAIYAAGCSHVAYTPRVLDPDATAAAYQARTPDTDGLKRFAAANGAETSTWPPREWGLRELTLVALYFHADIRLARAREAIARAELDASTRSGPWVARVGPEYHSRRLPEDSGPWTLGLQFEIPVVAQGKKAARVERSAFLADAAEMDVADAAWTVRSRVRDRYLDLLAARDAMGMLDAQVEARREMVALVSRRVDAGILSARELAVERIALSQLELQRGEEASRQVRAHGELAAALGLPMDVVDRMQLRFDARDAAGAGLDAAELRRLALRNRLDVHRKLLEFGAADAEVKSAVAAQNPDITLGPGYAWDRGDNIWSLAVGFTLPAGQVRAGIREAQARRELAAEAFAATQSAAISGAEHSAAHYRQAFERLIAAQRQLELQREQEERTRRQFDKGSADRMQRASSRMDTLASEAAVLAALAEMRRAAAGLEDAIQRPLLGDIERMPDMRAAGPTDTGTRP